LLPLLFLLTIPSLFKAWRDFQKEAQVKQIENGLPELLLSVSSLSTSFEKKLFIAANFNNGAALPFKKCRKMTLAGAPVQSAISSSFSNYSPLIRKTGDLLWLLYSRGNSTSPLIKEFALELYSLRESREQLKADSTIHKYSLLVSCAILVPLIIALIYSISSNTLNFIASPQPLLPNAVFLSVNIYLLILSFICAKYLAKQF